MRFAPTAVIVTLMISIGSIAWCVDAVPASQPSDAAPRAGRPGPWMQCMNDALGELNLTEQQRQQIDQIVEQGRQTMQDLRRELQESDLLPQERRQRMQEAAQTLRDEIAATLDDAQREIFDQRIDQWRRNMPGMGMMIDRLDNAIKNLELSDEQKQQIKTILTDARQQFEKIRQELSASGEQARGQFRTLMQQTRQKINDVLTPEQRDKVRKLLPGGGRGWGNKPAGRGPRSNDLRKNRDNAPPTEKPDESSVKPPEQPGASAPRFSLRKLDGSNVQLSSFQGRVLVLIFGSYSSPAFRDRASDIESLKRDVGHRASFLIVYTREAHAKGEWEVQRNRDDEIEIEQAKTESDRRQIAEKARDRLKLSIPIAMDDMTDSVASAYGATANSAYVIDRNGTIAYQQQWSDPASLARKLDEILRQPTEPQD